MKVTKNLLKIVLGQASGNLSMAVKILKNNHGIEITWHSIDKRIKNNPDVKEALDSACHEARDMAEHVLIKKIKAEDFKAVRYMLDRAERRDELRDRVTGGITEDKVITFGVKPKKTKEVKSEVGCDNLKEKEQPHDNPNS
jgi:hypothetical protein